MKYITKQGDTFDQIALNVYGSETAVAQIYMLNPEYLTVYQFAAGVVLELPEKIADVYESALPVWRRENND